MTNSIGIPAILENISGLNCIIGDFTDEQIALFKKSIKENGLQIGNIQVCNPETEIKFIPGNRIVRLQIESDDTAGVIKIYVDGKLQSRVKKLVLTIEPGKMNQAEITYHDGKIHPVTKIDNGFYTEEFHSIEI